LHSSQFFQWSENFTKINNVELAISASFVLIVFENSTNLQKKNKRRTMSDAENNWHAFGMLGSQNEKNDSEN